MRTKGVGMRTKRLACEVGNCGPSVAAIAGHFPSNAKSLTDSPDTHGLQPIAGKLRFSMEIIQNFVGWELKQFSNRKFSRLNPLFSPPKVEKNEGKTVIK